MTPELERALTAELLTLRRPAIIMIGVTAVLYLMLLLLIRGLEAEGKGNRLAGLFVGLNGRSLVHLSFAWCKFAFFAATLLGARPAEQTCYMLLLLLTAMTLLLGINRLGLWTTEFMSAALYTAGLWVGATLLNYLRQVRYDREIHIAYWLLSTFMILCAAVMLLREVGYISGERNYFDENGDVE